MIMVEILTENPLRCIIVAELKIEIFNFVGTCLFILYFYPTYFLILNEKEYKLF